MAHGRILMAGLLASILLFSGLANQVSAQDAPPELKQVKLTEAHIKGLISAQPALAAVAKRLEGMPDDAAVNVQDELNEIASKNGFADFNELDEISANVQLVLDGLDPETGEYSDPVQSLKEELELVKADASIDAEEKKALIAELEDALQALPPLEHEENIELVKKFQKEIQASLDQSN